VQTETLRPGTAEVRRLFPQPAWRAFLDTASYGLPPLATVEALERTLEEWRTARADWMRDWDAVADDCRPLAGDVLGARADDIALLPAASVGVGYVAARLTAADEVVVPDDEFRSLLFPLLVAERTRGARVRRVPFSDLASAVGDSTTVVATSHVRSNGGELQDLEAVAAAAHEHGADVLVDATQSAGILHVDADRLGLTFVVAAAYKHLLCPRGVAFMRIARERRIVLEPWNANWRSTADPYAGYYGGTLDDLAAGAARFDVSLAWHPWVGAVESLRTLALTDAREREAHCVGLATAAAESLGTKPTGSSVMTVPVRVSPAEARAALEEAGIAAGYPAGKVRLSFHVYNDRADVECAVSVLRSLR
jgi:selenocysteine lyase/cysteine desulfurase